MNMRVGAEEAVSWLATGSAGVSPAKPLESMQLSFFIHAGETPALPVAAMRQPLQFQPACFAKKSPSAIRRSTDYQDIE
jgi:hypothetical protein